MAALNSNSRSQSRDLYSEWIRPLLTTRSEVDARLGVGKGECRCVYETSDNTLTIRYSETRCDGGWNVDKETVLRFEIKPKSGVAKFSLNGDLSSFVKVTDDAKYSSYVDVKNGLIVSVSPYDEVELIEHVPNESQATQTGLRCAGSKPYGLTNRLYPISFSYDMKGWPADMSEIDNIAFHYRNSHDMKLYVMVYFKQGTSNVNKTRYLNSVNSRIRRILGKSAATVVITDGGTRKRSQVEVYILKEELPAPVPSAAPSK